MDDLLAEVGVRGVGVDENGRAVDRDLLSLCAAPGYDRQYAGMVTAVGHRYGF
jgi:hypothetical protein